MEDKDKKSKGEKVFDAMFILVLLLLLWDLIKGYPEKIKTLQAQRKYLDLLLWIGIPTSFIIYCFVK